MDSCATSAIGVNAHLTSPTAASPKVFGPDWGGRFCATCATCQMGTKWIRHHKNRCLCRTDGLCKRVSCGFVYQGLSTEMQHRDVLLMSRNFQREYKHCTIPATEWSNTWATAAQHCTLKPTRDKPRIVLTGRFIKNHQCGMKPRIPSPLPSEPIALPYVDAQTQQELCTLRAKIESHKSAEQECHGPWWSCNQPNWIRPNRIFTNT